MSWLTDIFQIVRIIRPQVQKIWIAFRTQSAKLMRERWKRSGFSHHTLTFFWLNFTTFFLVTFHHEMRYLFVLIILTTLERLRSIPHRKGRLCCCHSGGPAHASDQVCSHAWSSWATLCLGFIKCDRTCVCHRTASFARSPRLSAFTFVSGCCTGRDGCDPLISSSLFLSLFLLSSSVRLFYVCLFP